MLSAGLAAACGSPGGDGSPTVGAGNGLIGRPEDRSNGARPGGVYRTYITSDVPTFDVLATNSYGTLQSIASYAYPRLAKFVATKYPERPRGEVEGDLAETIETSGDRLQVIFRLRQGLRWDARPPTNSRPIDAQDVVFSWQRFLRLSPLRGDIAYDAATAPGGPVESVTSPDPRTVVFRLRQPDASVLGLFAAERLFHIMPREADGAFDPRYEIRGYGPWIMAENVANSLRAWTRNPDYHLKGRPYPDRLEQMMLGDYAARVAQFKAGNIWTSVAGNLDVVRIKRELPDTVLQRADFFPTTFGTIAFGYSADSPWKDERLRQAVSMLIDRETLIEMNSSRAKLRNEGLEIDIRYHTTTSAGWEGWWTDPLDESKFGPNSRYYGRDTDEARKLLTAAGFADGLDTSVFYNMGPQYGPIYTRTAELISGMLNEGGIRASLQPREYQNDWLPNYQLAHAAAANVGRPIKSFSGIAIRAGSAYSTPASQVFSMFHKDGVRFEGMTPDGNNPQLGDPEVNRQVESLRREFDIKKQQELAQDLARMMARKAYVIPNQPFAQLSYTLTWPVIGNLGLYVGWPGGSAATETAIHHWIDVTKPPLNQTP